MVLVDQHRDGDDPAREPQPPRLVRVPGAPAAVVEGPYGLRGPGTHRVSQGVGGAGWRDLLGHPEPQSHRPDDSIRQRRGNVLAYVVVVIDAACWVVTVKPFHGDVGGNPQVLRGPLHERASVGKAVEYATIVLSPGVSGGGLADWLPVAGARLPPGTVPDTTLHPFIGLRAGWTGPADGELDRAARALLTC